MYHTRHDRFLIFTVFFCCLILFSAAGSCLSYAAQEGFAHSTTVKGQGYNICLENLHIGDLVASYNLQTQQEGYRQVIAIQKVCVDRFIRFTLCNDTYLDVAPDQQFYLYALQRWASAQVIKDDRALAHAWGPLIYDIQEIDESMAAVMITVESNHNFYVTG